MLTTCWRILHRHIFLGVLDEWCRLLHQTDGRINGHAHVAEKEWECSYSLQSTQ